MTRGHSHGASERYIAFTRSKYHSTRNRAAICSSDSTTTLSPVSFSIGSKTKPIVCRSSAIGEVPDSATNLRTRSYWARLFALAVKTSATSGNVTVSAPSATTSKLAIRPPETIGGAREGNAKLDPFTTTAPVTSKSQRVPIRIEPVGTDRPQHRSGRSPHEVRGRARHTRIDAPTGTNGASSRVASAAHSAG